MEQAWKVREGRRFSKRWKKLIPEVYSTHITPSYLSLGFSKESGKSERRQTKDKDKEGIRWRWEGREGEGQATRGWFGGSLSTWCTPGPPSFTSSHVSEMKALIGQLLCRGQRSRLTHTCSLYHPNPFSGSSGFEMFFLSYSPKQKIRCL